MKKLLFVLALVFVFGTAKSQILFEYSPPVATYKVDSCWTTAGSDTLKTKKIPTAVIYDSVTVGMRLVGANIPFGATVKSKKDSANLIMSTAATVTDTNMVVHFPVFVGSMAYVRLDAMGFPFYIGQPRKINNVWVIDGSKLTTAVKLWLLDSLFTPTQDTSAWSLTDAEAKHVIGIYNLNVVDTTALNAVLSPAATTLPIYLPGTKIYCQLQAISTPTFTSKSDITVKMILDGD